MVILGIDVGFGWVKGISSLGLRTGFRAAIGEFQPIKFVSGISKTNLIGTAIEYEGKRLYIGEAALKQSVPQVTIDPKRTIGYEGLALLMAAFSLLIPELIEDVYLIIGLPILHYSRLKDEYIKAVLKTHIFDVLSFDGDQKRKKVITVRGVKVLPQPFGTFFNLLLDNEGRIIDSKMADGSIGIVDNGFNTVDLLRVENLEYIEPRSISFSEMGVYSVCKSFSEKLYQQFGVEISPENSESYLERDLITIRGKDVSIRDLKMDCYRIEAENIISRIKSTWPDYPLLSRIPLTGGGIINICDHLTREFGNATMRVSNPMWGNAEGYVKFGKRVWKI